jgi:GT2 family glycosyltransferase
MSRSAQLRGSVVICTANRRPRLAETLETLLPHVDARPARDVEVIVIDNGSTDDTPRLLGEAAAAHPGTLRAVREERAGLSAARNRGVREARGEVLLFLDDDALPAPGWLDSYLSAFDGSGVAAAGGPVEPIFDGPLPAWLDARFLPYLSVWDRGPEAIRLRYNELPRGANMAIRRAAFAAYGDFLEQLGRKGESLRSCEEIELFLRLERGGEEILYLPAARVRHHVGTQRLTAGWMNARFAAQGFSEAIIDWRHAGARGLRTGLARVAPYSRAAAADVLHAALRHASRGYRKGALYALFCVAPYQLPSVSDGADLKRFEPPA